MLNLIRILFLYIEKRIMPKEYINENFYIKWVFKSIFIIEENILKE